MPSALLPLAKCKFIVSSSQLMLVVVFFGNGTTNTFGGSGIKNKAKGQ